MTWVAVATVAAYVVNRYNTTNTARKQDNALAAKERMDMFNQSLSNQNVRDLVNKTAKSTPQAAKAKDLNSFLDTIRQHYALTNSASAPHGNVSGAYDQAAKDAAAGVSQYADTRAGNMAGMMAPIQQRQQEAANRSDTAMALSSLARKAKMQDFLANMKIAAIKRNPWLDLLSTGLKAYAGAKASAGGFGGATPKSSMPLNYSSGGGLYTPTSFSPSIDPMNASTYKVYG